MPNVYTLELCPWLLVGLAIKLCQVNVKNVINLDVPSYQATASDTQLRLVSSTFFDRAVTTFGYKMKLPEVALYLVTRCFVYA